MAACCRMFAAEFKADDADFVTNIRQCSVTDEIGIVSLELDGERSGQSRHQVAGKIGVSVEPVEINVIES